MVRPHGLTTVVTSRGAVKVEPIRDHNGTVIGEIYDSPFQIDVSQLLK